MDYKDVLTWYFQGQLGNPVFVGFYQSIKRINKNRVLDDVEIDIDSWPMIPTYVEIEGKDEQSVMKMVDKLELDKSKLTALDVMSVYDQIYHIDMNKIKHLKF